MNYMPKLFLLLVALAAALAVNVARGAAEVGKPAPEFALVDIQGRAHKLSDYKGKIVVIEWVNPECPIVVKHYNSQNMQGTQKSAAADGAVWLSINSAGYEGAQGDLSDEAAAAWQKKMGAVTTGYFRDRTSKKSVAVSYTGAIPDPFREGREVIITVRSAGAGAPAHSFIGEKDTLITKCPSKFKESEPAAPASGAKKS